MSIANIFLSRDFEKKLYFPDREAGYGGESGFDFVAHVGGEIGEHGSGVAPEAVLRDFDSFGEIWISFLEDFFDGMGGAAPVESFFVFRAQDAAWETGGAEMYHGGVFFVGSDNGAEILSGQDDDGSGELACFFGNSFFDYDAFDIVGQAHGDLLPVDHSIALRNFLRSASPPEEDASVAGAEIGEFVFPAAMFSDLYQGGLLNLKSGESPAGARMSRLMTFS